MSIKLRQMMENRIARVLLKAAFKAGYAVKVYDGEETTIALTDTKQILDVMFGVDECYVLLYRADGNGWVRFIFGNSGWDVINDYSVNLESIMAEVHALSDKLSEKWG